MMYVIVILIGVLLLLYFGGRWLLHESREVGFVLRKLIKQATGGQTEDTLIRQAHAAFSERGLPAPDMVAVPRDTEKLYDALRSEVIGRVPEPALPAAVGIVLAICIDGGYIYLHAVSAAPGEAGSEHDGFLEFDDVAEIRAVPTVAHPAIASSAESALELQQHDASGPAFHMPIDPAWGIDADDLVRHVTAMIRERRKPGGGTVILR
ncbi:MAG: hypothetical protein WEC99_05155 [Halofilum sp. (in: g-proteobacteria)]